MNGIVKKISLSLILIIILTICFSMTVIDIYAFTQKTFSGSATSAISSVRTNLTNTGCPGGTCPGVSSDIGTDNRFDNIDEYEKIQEESKAYYSIVKEKMKDAYDNKGLKKAMDSFNEHAQYVYGFLMAFGALTSLLMFIIIFVRITWLPEHAIQKRRAMEDMVISGIATALLGGSWLIISLFYSIFARMWEMGTVYSKNWQEVGGVFLTEYRGLIVGFLGVATLTALLMTIKAIMGVIFAGTNPGQKSAKMMQVIWCGIATAGLGSLTLFTSLFWNVFRL